MVGCNRDPTSDELARGENIDIERTQGTVSEKSVHYFLGNTPDTTGRKGKPYYTVTIATRGAASNDKFIGVPTHVYDSVEIGTVLPAKPTLSLKNLGEIEGKVVDRVADIVNNKFYIVVDNTHKINIYMVDRDLFYRKLDIGSRLPVQWDEAAIKQ